MNPGLQELLKEGKRILGEAGVAEAGTDAWLLLSHVTGIDRARYFAHPELTAAPEQAQEYRRLIGLRSQRIPLQHLTGEAWFMGYPFLVNRHVLIPRQDTEVLVLEALKRLEGRKKPKVLDLCTGSGCILVSLLAEREDAEGIGADISAEALQVAEENARRLHTEKRCRFVREDVLSGQFFGEKDGNHTAGYDILVSNPPYIPTREIGTLAEEVRLHDPEIALDGGADGLLFYRKLTAEAMGLLKEGGYLLYEIGSGQGDAVRALLEENGFREIEIIRDLAGLDRVAAGRRPTGGDEDV